MRETVTGNIATRSDFESWRRQKKIEQGLENLTKRIREFTNAIQANTSKG